MGTVTVAQECRVCGAGWVRPVCAEWCERVRAMLRGPERPVLAGVTHGKRRSYQLGCRCPLCTAAASAYSRSYEARKKAAA